MPSNSLPIHQQHHALENNKKEHIVDRSFPFRGCTVWFTGLSGAGKTTLSMKLEHYLLHKEIPAYTLDGDNIRCGLNKDLGFAPEDAVESNRRISEVAKLFADVGFVCLVSFVSPYRKDRASARHLHDEAGLPFIEVFADAPLEVCEHRDVKRLYKKAKSGDCKVFIGTNSPYEKPENAEVIIKTDEQSVAYCLLEVVKGLVANGILPSEISLPTKETFHMEEHDKRAKQIS